MKRNNLKYLVLTIFAIVALIFYFSINPKNNNLPIEKVTSENQNLQNLEQPNKTSNKEIFSNKIDVPKDKYSANGYLLAKNIKSYIESLQSTDEKSIPIVKAKGIEECATVFLRPNYIDESIQARKLISQRNISLYETYVKETSSRCSDLASITPISKKQADEYYNQSASQNIPEAIAYEIKKDASVIFRNPNPDAIEINQLRNNVIDLVGSGDASAIFSLSDIFNENSKFTGIAVGSSIASAAWQLAACDMGLDCSANSTIIRNFCVNGGIYCEPGDLRSNMQYGAFSPIDFSKVLELEGLIYQNLKSGTPQNLFLN